MRFRDFLRVSVLIYAGAATALAVVSIAGATRADTNTLVYLAAVWWCVAMLAGLWIGRRPQTTEGIATLLADARSTNSLPELEPGSVTGSSPPSASRACAFGRAQATAACSPPGPR
jgi:hypothetical protein